MSKTSLFSPLSTAVTTLLFWIFYQEYQHLTWTAILGILLSFVAIYVFVSGKRAKQENKGSMATWLALIVIWALVVGVKDFLIKVFASNEMPNHHFLTYYYTGSFFFSSVAFMSLSRRQISVASRGHIPGAGSLYVLALLSSFSIVSNQAAEYWGFQISPGSSVISLQGLNSVFIPVLMGLFFFKEGSCLSKRDVFGFSLGVAAAILIVLF